MTIRNWYKEEHQEDGDFYKAIKSKITFEELIKRLNGGETIENITGCGDSVVRDNIIEKLCEITNRTFKSIQRQNWNNI